jgi:hypothetical protein
MSVSQIAKLKTLTHKPGVNKDDWDKVHRALLALAEYTTTYCETYKLALVITSIIRPRIPGVSVSDTHAEGRAFDISVRGWSREAIRDFVDSINEIFTIGAISLRDKKEREAVYEDGVAKGFGAHIHIQVRAKAEVPHVPAIDLTSESRSAS